MQVVGRTPQTVRPNEALGCLRIVVSFQYFSKELLLCVWLCCRYVPPNRRQHLPDQAQRGPAPAPPLASAQQPLPQRERRADRDRGDRGQDGRGDRGWERNPQPRAQHSVPGPYGPPSHGPTSERLNGGGERVRVVKCVRPTVVSEKGILTVSCLFCYISAMLSNIFCIRKRSLWLKKRYFVCVFWVVW